MMNAVFNHRFFNHRFFNHRFFNHRFFNHRSLGLTSVVATLFSLVVALLLMRDFAGRVQSDVIEPSAIMALRQRLREQPGDPQLRQAIRDLDVVLREDYFRSRRDTRRGAYLLAAGVGLAALSGTIARTLGRRALQPPEVLDRQLVASRETRRGLRAVAVLGGVLVAGSVVMAWNYRTGLDDSIGGSNAPERVAKGNLVKGDRPSYEDSARNWPTFRGQHGRGIALGGDRPVRWDVTTGEGVLWKTPVPLPGNNSPIVWEDRIFLTGATNQRREVYCFQRTTGELSWQGDVPGAARGGSADSSAPADVSEETGYAAPTAATDGRRVFVIFAQGDLAAFDLQGQMVWHRNLGVPENAYGHASSLALAGQLLIVQFDQGSKRQRRSRLLAFQVQTGKTVWEVVRDVPNSWSSPVVIQQGEPGGHEGSPRIITCADPWVIAYAVDDGTEIWRAKCLRQDVGPTPVYSEGVLFVASEFPGVSAIRMGGLGDVTESHLLWTAEFGAPDTCSPLAGDGLLMVLASYGTLTCYDAAEGGEPLWEEDFDDTFRSSPTRIGQHVYLFGESGKVWVVQPGREQCLAVAESDLGETCVTSPAVVDGRIYIRGEKHLFCLGE